MAKKDSEGSPRPSLTRKDWINAAIEVMVASSVEQIRLDKLAAELNATKGSFYHHFKDRQELLMAVLEAWKQRATLAIHDRLEKAEPAPMRQLFLYMQLPVRSEAALRAADLELAILGWARRSPAANRALGQVDQLRTEKLASLFLDFGLEPKEAYLRAHKAYGFIRYISQRRDMELTERLRLLAVIHAELASEPTGGGQA